MADELSFIIPGPPPSLNHSYRPIRAKNRSGGYSLRMAKHDTVLAYQVYVSHLVKLARPSGYQPPSGYIRVQYRFYLKRSIDCDNAMKALNDAIAQALDVNDARFLPCVMSKSVNSKEPEPRVEVTLSDPESAS